MTMVEEQTEQTEQTPRGPAREGGVATKRGGAGNGDAARWIGTAMAYVPHVARRYVGCGLPFDELVAAGNLGLVEAALRYQPERKVKFVTYADWWVRKSIFKALEEQSGPVRLPRYRQEQLRTIKEGRRIWQRRTGSDPDSDELAGVTGFSRDEVERLRGLGQSALSLDDPSLPGSDRPLGEVLAVEDSAGPQDTLVRSDLVRYVRDLVDTLDAKEQQVIELRFGLQTAEPLTLRAIGARLGVSRERVRQIERRALIRLRNAL